MILRFNIWILPFSILLFISCSSDDSQPKPVPTPSPSFFFTVTGVEETFDQEGRIYVRASINDLQIDTVESYGFIYTDGLDGENAHADPLFETDHKVFSENLEMNDDQNSYIFDTLIKPRIEAHFNSSVVVVNIAAFIISKNGKVYISETKSINALNIVFGSIYPLYSPPGTLVKGIVNSSVKDGGFFDVTKGNHHKMIISIGEDIIPFEENFSSFSFYMPEGINEEMPLKIRVGDYEIKSKYFVKNTELVFSSLSSLSREFASETLLFATRDGIFWGGGSIKGDPQTTLTDFYRYDFTSDSWSSIADYPSNGLGRGMVFTIEGQAYCGTPPYLDRYDPTADTWVRMAKPTTTLQYDHTFGDAAVGVYKGKAYLTNFDKELKFGTYHNFHRYDPMTGSYEIMPAYPGPNLKSQYMDQAVEYNDLLHYFPGLQHWTYDVNKGLWNQLKDVSEKGEYIKPFLLKNELYALKGEYEFDTFPRGDFHSYFLKYHQDSDSWERESDFPHNNNYADAYVLQVDTDNVFIGQVTYSDPSIQIYKFQ